MEELGRSYDTLSKNDFSYNELKEIQNDLIKLHNMVKTKLTCVIKATSNKVTLPSGFDSYKVQIFGCSIDLLVETLPPSGKIIITLYEECNHVPDFSVFYQGKCITWNEDFEQSLTLAVIDNGDRVGVSY